MLRPANRNWARHHHASRNRKANAAPERFSGSSSRNLSSRRDQRRFAGPGFSTTLFPLCAVSGSAFFFPRPRLVFFHFSSGGRTSTFTGMRGANFFGLGGSFSSGFDVIRQLSYPQLDADQA